ncbi:hypothetical protein FRC01_009196 [Tulasnella sp. 417]|nr:hypothetical protein FRC01_009196 [Tulasnella sp. 417]
MAECVTTPRQTIFSTPVNVQTITNTVTTVITNPGREVTETFYYTECIDDDFGGRFRRLKRQVECPNGTTVSTSYSVSSFDITYDYVTSRGDPVAVETQYGSSCSDIETTPSPSPRTTTTTPRQTSASSTSIFVPSPTPQPSPISRSSVSSATSSSSSATATQDNVVVGHKSHKTAAIAGGIAGAVLFLAAVAGAVWYFKFFKGGGAGKGGHHGHHGGEKDGVEAGTGGGGGGGASGAPHAPGVGHVAHNIAPPHLGGTGVETSGVGGGGGGAGGPAGTAPGGGAGMDTSAVAGGGYGGTAPPATGFEGQFSVNTLPPGASVPAHHAYPVLVPVGARRRESQGPQEMVNTLSTPWIDPAQQQQQQGSYYYPQQGPPQPWQNADPYTSASSGAQYPGSGPGWVDQAYYASQSGYHNGGAQYPADPRASQQYPVDPRTSQQYSVDPRTSQGYPTDPRASGAYYPTPASGHTSPVNNANPNRMSVVSSPSSTGHPRQNLLPYMNEYGAPQPAPSVASTPAPPSSTAGTSADPFDKHAEASAAAAAGPSDHDELPPPSYDEAGPSAQPFVPQDAKGRQQ